MLSPDYRIAEMKKDIINLIEMIDDLERVMKNSNDDRKEQYMLINDRIDEAFDIIKMIERKIP
mgnify:CR=1 FL=1